MRWGVSGAGPATCRALLLVAFAVSAPAQQPGVPQLRYQPPPNYTKNATTPPDDYTSNEYSASIQIYPFRPFAGNIEQILKATMLADWVLPRYRERVITRTPEFKQTPIRGSDLAVSARFSETVAGMPNERLRLAIVSNNMVAIVDITANSVATWNRAVPALNSFNNSLRVDIVPAARSPQTPPANSPGTAAIAGIYRGTKPKPKNPARPGDSVMTPHFYLFSADGRVYRTYDNINLPGGAPDRFDFETARKTDPGNYGRYTIVGNQMRIVMSGNPPEVFVGAVPKDGRVSIQNVVYVRQSR